MRRTPVGREYAGRFRPSMFVTLTCDSYGRVRQDGTPVDPDSYDYRRVARDAVHFASLVDRWWQNLRRVVGGTCSTSPSSSRSAGPPRTCTRRCVSRSRTR